VGLKNKEVSVPFEVEALKLHVKKKDSTKFILTVYSILSFQRLKSLMPGVNFVHFSKVKMPRPHAFINPGKSFINPGKYREPFHFDSMQINRFTREHN